MLYRHYLTLKDISKTKLKPLTNDFIAPTLASRKHTYIILTPLNPTFI